MVGSIYSPNDWRNYFEHGWGTKPEQKKREKEYNAWYYKTHKDEIMAKRKARKGTTIRDDRDESETDETPANSSNGELTRISSNESFKQRVDEEIDLIRRLIESNEAEGGFTPGEMANIKRHNEMIIENLEKLYSHVSSKSSSYSPEDQARLWEKIQEQIDHAHDVILDTKSEKSNAYLSSIGIHKQKKEVKEGSVGESVRKGMVGSGAGKDRGSGGRLNGYKYEDVLASRRKGDAQIRELQKQKEAELKKKEEEERRRRRAKSRPTGRETNVTGSGTVKRRGSGLGESNRANKYER